MRPEIIKIDLSLFIPRPIRDHRIEKEGFKMFQLHNHDETVSLILVTEALLNHHLPYIDLTDPNPQFGVRVRVEGICDRDSRNFLRERDIRLNAICVYEFKVLALAVPIPLRIQVVQRQIESRLILYTDKPQSSDPHRHQSQSGSSSGKHSTDRSPRSSGGSSSHHMRSADASAPRTPMARQSSLPNRSTRVDQSSNNPPEDNQSYLRALLEIITHPLSYNQAKDDKPKTSTTHKPSRAVASVRGSRRERKKVVKKTTKPIRKATAKPTRATEHGTLGIDKNSSKRNKTEGGKVNESIHAIPIKDIDALGTTPSKSTLRKRKGPRTIHEEIVISYSTVERQKE